MTLERSSSAEDAAVGFCLAFVCLASITCCSYCSRLAMIMRLFIDNYY